MSTTRVETASEPSDPVIQNPVKRKWVSYIWDTFDKSPEERRLLFKLDSAILTFASLGKLFTLIALEIDADCISWLQVTLSSTLIRLTSTMLSCLECRLRLSIFWTQRPDSI
jgi:hypothetical protein